MPLFEISLWLVTDSFCEHQESNTDPPGAGSKSKQKQRNDYVSASGYPVDERTS